MGNLYAALARHLARHPKQVLMIASAVTLLSAAFSFRIEVKTGFQDTMSREEPAVARLAYMAENFPGAITVQAVFEGNNPDRMVDAARTFSIGVRAHEDIVKDVYFEQDVEFFTSRALLYLSQADLQRTDESLASNEDTLRTLLKDPSTLGLMRALRELTHENFPAEGHALTVSGNVFGRVLWDEILAGKPAAKVGVRVDPNPTGRHVRELLLQHIEEMPLPPSDERAQKLLSSTHRILELVAEVLERGRDFTGTELEERLRRLREVEVSAPGNALPSRYRLSADKRMLLVEVASQKDVTKLENIAPLLEVLEREQEKIEKSHPDVKLQFTGMPVLYRQEQDAILDNFVLVTILGLFGILAVFIIGFERVGLPSMSVIPLVAGVLWTLGLQGAFRPELNMLNLLFPVLLFGLGIDFAIHLLSGYLDDRAAGRTVEDSLVHLYEATVPGLVIGAVTTSTSFLVMLFASLKGLRELGFTAGVGVLMVLFAILTVFPALLVLWGDRVVRKKRGQLAAGSSYLGRLARFCETARFGVLAVFLVVTLVFAYFVPRVGLDRDASRLQPVGMPAAVLQQRVLDTFSISGEPSIFFAKDLQEAREIFQRAQQAKTVAEPLSITLALPEESDEKARFIARIRERLQAVQPPDAPPPHAYDEQEAKEVRKHVAELKAILLQLSGLGSALYTEETQGQIGAIRDVVNRIDRRLDASGLDNLRYLDEILQRELKSTAEMFVEMTNHQQVQVEDLPTSLVSRVQGKDGKWVVAVRANQYVFDAKFLKKHVEELEAIHVDHTGLVPVWYRMLEKILEDLPKLTLFTLVAVAFLVLLSLRSWTGALLSLAPMLVGMVWTLGLLGMLNIDLNFVSLLAIPLVVGIGIDDGVHIYHRIVHDRNLESALQHSGRAVVLTSLTTGIGFGSLLLSVHRGVFYLGLTTTIGVVVCLLLSLVLMPALVAIFQEDVLDGPADSEFESGPEQSIVVVQSASEPVDRAESVHP